MFSVVLNDLFQAAPVQSYLSIPKKDPLLFRGKKELFLRYILIDKGVN